MAPRAQGGKGRTPRREFTERGDGGGRRHGLCRFFQQTGHCKFGSKCKFPHDPSSTLNSEEPSRQFLERKEETPEQILAKAKYISWKRLIKIPPKQNDIATIRLLWTGALTILNGDDRDWKQMLPRDLDDQHNYGREHIQTLLSMVARSHGSGTFIDLAQPFLLVITHSALLDCLSVDTFVGTLYNFISGSNGTRAIPFFQRLSKCLLDIHVETSVTRSIANFETMLVAISTALWELLKRERRVTFHDDLPDLLNSLEKITKICSIDKQSAPFQLVANRIGELRAMIAHANHLLSHEEKPQGDGVSTVVTSVYPRDIVLPQDRYDNDKMDISKIKILPTEDEIRSNHAEFLPSTEPDQPHFLTDKAQRHFDTQFRLLRHDIFGELKEALGGLMTSVENNPTLLDNVKLGLGNIRAYPYPKAHIRYISFDKRRGLEAQISFAQPFLLRKKQPPERRRWWEESKRLEEGVLLCFVSLINLKSSLLFFVASERCVDTKKQHSLSSHDYLGTITAKLATRTQSDMELMIRLSGNDTGGVLLEFPGVLLASFIPILENLQQMQQLSRLPFRQWILPDPITLHGNASKLLDIPPPLYARDPCFTFSLKSILKNPNTDFSLRSSALVKDNSTINKLEAQTELDRGQCEALIAALTREFAFIQGPPGTGKSYLGVQLMKVLLACKSKAHLGPIVVVCYTNHALDQFLEHLSKIGIEKIIRIGGQSQSTILERKNLRIVSQGEMKTKSERYLLATAYSALESERRRIESTLHLLNSIGKRPEWTNLKIHLNQKYPRIHSQFSLVDEDGFQIVGKEPFEDWSQWLRGEFLGESDKSDKTEPTPKEIEHILKVANQNVHSLSLSDRARLIEFWTKEIREDSTDELFELVERDDTLRQKLTNIHDDVDRRVLQTADVIGVTTTGLARRISTLQHVACKVVICEEAGEVMEPHMISALLPSVQHLIQIGDHQQLRPKINNYGLSLESQQGTPYQLDRSQFERLSVGGRGRPTVPVAQLNVQRRMRPEISTLVRETIYPRLVDHTSTKNLPNVVGMRKNVFWFDHDNTEEGPQVDVHQKSHSNVWEVEMTYALVRHIVHQGAYSSSEIAVLTPYTGQLQKLRAVMRNDFEIVLSERDQEMLAKDGFGVEDNDPESEQRTNQLDSEKKPLEKKKLSELLRVATVDNFQGEEAKIVIMSLVRSNKEKKVGFLRTTNRINVLLSRAQHGMYLIGNIETYSNIPMWAKVLGRLQMTDSVGEAFDLCCPRHPDIEMKMTLPGLVLKVDANFLAIDASLVAAIDAKQGVTLRACTKFFHVPNLANASTARAITAVRSKRVVRTAVFALLN
ncbi:MAG: hypothetical protein M1834_002680 [Cirrosporium novae-zelandiae]|nr:MAG: hypothetical protein M1834_002680 [Cirrosporium novae-zelandiae]